jgi:hypothetical protein
MARECEGRPVRSTDGFVADAWGREHQIEMIPFRPKEMDTQQRIGACCQLDLSGNLRSSGPIIQENSSADDQDRWDQPFRDRSHAGANISLLKENSYYADIGGQTGN